MTAEPAENTTREPLLVDHTDGVVTLTLNRPESLNSFDVALKLALRDAVESAEADRTCRAIVLTGAGRAFCVGQDLKEHVEVLAATSAAADTRGTVAEATSGVVAADSPLGTVVEHFNPLVRRLAALPKPVVAAVRGMAAGAGASLALLADFRIGGPKTAFLMAFANVGLAGDTGASWTLPRLVGYAKATEMLMLAEPVGAEEALRLGLLTRLVSADGDVLPAAQELAARLAAGPTVAYGQIKRQLLAGASGDLDQALEAEADAQRIAGATDDHRNATAAFVAKEKPTFIGA
jgi:2-(1,2-epoxy-1,2-dihydrophenyl)acetyl-CoA isomerase